MYAVVLVFACVFASSHHSAVSHFVGCCFCLWVNVHLGAVHPKPGHMEHSCRAFSSHCNEAGGQQSHVEVRALQETNASEKPTGHISAVSWNTPDLSCHSDSEAKILVAPSTQPTRIWVKCPFKRSNWSRLQQY